MFEYFAVLQEWLEPKYHLVAQSPADNYDPGDTAQREGMVIVGSYILVKSGKMSNEEFSQLVERYERVIGLLNDPNHDGLIRRYPDQSYWGGLSDRMSRDQAIPNVIGMGFVNQSRLQKFWDGHTKYSYRWFSTNTRDNWAQSPGNPNYDSKRYQWKVPDLTIGSFTALYIRAFQKRDLLSKVRLWFYDFQMLLETLHKVHIYGRDLTNSDDLNHIMDMYQAEIESPTWFSKLALYYYLKNRPYPTLPKEFEVPEARNPMQACMNSYFRDGNRGPKLEVFYKDVNDYMTQTFTWDLKGKFE